MTDTPETDAKRLTEKNGCILTVGAEQVVPAEFARRLERERDKAKREYTAELARESHLHLIKILSGNQP
jgi:hypothetical protein